VVLDGRQVHSGTDGRQVHSGTDGRQVHSGTDGIQVHRGTDSRHVHSVTDSSLTQLLTHFVQFRRPFSELRDDAHGHTVPFCAIFRLALGANRYVLTCRIFGACVS